MCYKLHCALKLQTPAASGPSFPPTALRFFNLSIDIFLFVYVHKYELINNSPGRQTILFILFFPAIALLFCLRSVNILVGLLYFPLLTSEFNCLLQIFCICVPHIGWGTQILHRYTQTKYFFFLPDLLHFLFLITSLIIFSFIYFR